MAKDDIPQRVKEVFAEWKQDYPAGKDQAVASGQKEGLETLIALAERIGPMREPAGAPKKSDPDRLGQVFTQIGQIKAAQYPAVVGREGEYRIIDRPWVELPEMSKLAMLRDAVDWSGITNRDRGHILLAQIDPGKISDVERNRLIDMAESQPTLVRADEGQSLPATEMDMDRGR